MGALSKLRQLKAVSTDLRWWPFYLQRRFMSPAGRRRATTVATWLRPGIASHEVPPEALGTRLEQLRDAGISHYGQLLSAQQAAELRDYFSAQLVQDTYRPEQGRFLPGSDARHPESHIAHHDAADVIRAPYLFALANDPRILAVVSRYLGCRPTLGYLAVWWSYHTGVGAQHAENFHRDVDDWRFVKLFVYLSDVAADNGPHVYVSHSAASSKLRQVRRLSDAEVTAAFGSEKVLTMTGRAGEGFLEDTFGIHKGQPVGVGRRLMFQAVYSMFALPYGPKEPVARLTEVSRMHGVEVDPWVNRLYVRT